MRAVIFDLDGTLAESKASLDGRFAGFLTSSRMLRTSCCEAMVQPGTMASSDVSEAMGIRPRSNGPRRVPICANCGHRGRLSYSGP